LPIAAAHLWNSLPSHVTAALSLSPSSAVILTQHFFALQLYNSSLICTVPAQWLVILDTIMITITCIYNTYNSLLDCGGNIAPVKYW